MGTQPAWPGREQQGHVPCSAPAPLCHPPSAHLPLPLPSTSQEQNPTKAGSSSLPLPSPSPVTAAPGRLYRRQLRPRGTARCAGPCTFDPH